MEQNDLDQIKEHWNNGLGCRKIGKLMNIDKSKVLWNAKRMGLKAHEAHHNHITLTYFQKSALIGMILGDAYLSKEGIGSLINFAHQIPQQEYALHKIEILKPIETSSLLYPEYFDKRTGKTYKRIAYTSKTYIELKEFRNIFYPIKKKIIPMEYIKNNFNEISLAYMYMDDGNKADYSITIATCGFEKENIKEFIDFLKFAFNLDCTILGNNSIRIRQKSVKRFFDLTSKYINEVECMKYKVVIKQDELLENPEEDNQQPS